MTENTNDWLAQELVPAVSTASTDDCLTTRVLIIRYRWIIALGFGMVCSAFFAYLLVMSNPPFTVEIRDVSAGGAVTYVPQEYKKWSKNGNIAAIRQHTLSRIYHSVYYGGLQYNFSQSGHVYATEGNELPAPFNVVRVWDWSGDPHHFPYYSFSHTWNEGES